MNSIIVLHGPRAGHSRPGVQDAVLARLAYARRLALEARSPEDRAASLAGLAVACAALRASTGRVYDVGDFVFVQDGKPLVRGAPSFSISHSARSLGCAVASSGAVGFDIEDLDSRRPATQVERWTAVEATLKAAGVGLRTARKVELDMERLRSRLGDVEYVLTPVELGCDCRAFLATSVAADSIDIRSVDAHECLSTAALPGASGTDTMPPLLPSEDPGRPVA